MINTPGSLGGDLMRALPAHVSIRPATAQDAKVLGPQLRPEDGAEILAWWLLPHEGIEIAVGQATEAWAVETAEGVQCVFGVREVASGVGHPWLLVSASAAKSRRHLVIMARKFLARWHERWPLLVTWSWAGAPRNHAWLKHLGFTPINMAQTSPWSPVLLEFVKIREENPVGDRNNACDCRGGISPCDRGLHDSELRSV